MKRQRGRNRNKNNNNNNRQLDSTGPDVKLRGSASHIFDKYTALARDAASSGNRVKAENYRQHAEHYQRLVNVQLAAVEARREAQEKAAAENNTATDAEDGADKNESENGEERRGRRYPPRVRKQKDRHLESDGDKAKAKTKVSSSTSDDNSKDADDSKTMPESEGVNQETEEKMDVAEEKPTRRRKAPAR